MNRMLRASAVLVSGLLVVCLVLVGVVWSDGAPGSGDVTTDRAYLPALVHGSPEWNLLRNADLEGTYVQFAYFHTAVMAPEWLPWWVAQGADDPPWKSRMPIMDFDRLNR